MILEELEIVIKANIEQAMSELRRISKAIKDVSEQSIVPLEKATKQFNTTVSQSMGVAVARVNNLRSAIKSTTAEQEMLIRKMEFYEGLIDEATRDGKAFNSQEVLEYRVELEKLQNKFTSLSNEGTKTGNQIDKSMKSAGKSIKKLGLLLLGARSVFLLFRRGIQMALQSNDQLRTQSEMTSQLLGQMFVPAVQLALNAVQYLLIGMALLIEMFTGYNAIAEMTNATLKKMGKEATKTKRSLLGMDEITNLEQEDTGLASGISAQQDAMEEFAKKVEQVKKLFDEWNIQGLVDKLKDLGKWIWENKEAVLLFGGVLTALFIGAKLGALLTGIGALSTGLGILVGILAAIAIVHYIGLAVKGYDETKKALEAVEKHLKNISILRDETLTNIQKRFLLGEMTNEEIVKTVDNMMKIKKASAEEYNILLNQYKQKTKELGVMFLMSKEADVMRQQMSEIEKESKQLVDTLEMMTGKAWEIKLNADINGTEMQTKINNIVTKAMSGVNSVFKLLGIKVPKFATGTVATQPTMGVFGEYSGARTNPEIVSPKNDMIDAVAQALQLYGGNESKDGSYVFKVNGRELARAIYDDLQYEGNRLGQQTTSVRRVG